MFKLWQIIVLPLACTLALLLILHHMFTRNPCMTHVEMGKHAWGEGAWHSGVGACAPKPWWQL